MNKLLMLFFCVSSTLTYAKDTSFKTVISHLEGSWINFTIENTLKEEVCIDTRIIGLDGESTSPIFLIFDGENEVAYKGIYTSRNENYTPNHIVLLPKQIISVKINLAADYNLLKGKKYKIYQQAFSAARCENKFHAFEFISNKIEFSL